MVNRGFEECRNEWYTRSVALYHQFDIENGRTLWITTSGREDIQLRIQDLTGKNARLENTSFETPETSLCLSFQTHLLLCQWSLEGWSDYLFHLEDLVEQEVRFSLSRAFCSLY